MNILAFGASNSRNSINAQLATFAAARLAERNGASQVEVLDLNDFEMPLYSIDRETHSGIPALARSFHNKIGAADLLLISLAEHNGSYSVAFKNIFDWVSRLEGSLFQDKKMILLATSPGGRGGQSVLSAATNRFPHMGGQLLGSLSVPRFGDVFHNGALVDAPLLQDLDALLTKAA